MLTKHACRIAPGEREEIELMEHCEGRVADVTGAAKAIGRAVGGRSVVQEGELALLATAKGVR